jgi:hypothetical protein
VAIQQNRKEEIDTLRSEDTEILEQPKVWASKV